MIEVIWLKNNRFIKVSGSTATFMLWLAVGVVIS